MRIQVRAVQSLATFVLNFAVVFGVLIATPGVVVAQELGSANSMYLLCKKSTQVRTLRVENQNTTCRATYTKDGVESVVGKFTEDSKCREVLDQIKITLEAKAWKCKDISASRVSYSNN